MIIYNDFCFGEGDLLNKVIYLVDVNSIMAGDDEEQKFINKTMSVLNAINNMNEDDEWRCKEHDFGASIHPRQSTNGLLYLKGNVFLKNKSSYCWNYKSKRKKCVSSMFLTIVTHKLILIVFQM